MFKKCSVWQKLNFECFNFFLASWKIPLFHNSVAKKRRGKSLQSAHYNGTHSRNNFFYNLTLKKTEKKTDFGCCVVPRDKDDSRFHRKPLELQKK